MELALPRRDERQGGAEFPRRFTDHRLAGRMTPRGSAPSTMARAIRSLGELVGLADSSFSQTSPRSDPARRSRRTTGAFPIARAGPAVPRSRSSA